MLPALCPLRFTCAASLLVGAPALQAQSHDRIWGRVFTTEGREYEGFLEFGRGQRAASWTDVLVGSRKVPDENYHAWLLAVHDGRPAIRTVEVKGHRVSWEERHRDFVNTTRTGIRFGHLAALVLDDQGRMEIVLRGSAGTAQQGAGGAAREGGVSPSAAGVRTLTTTAGRVRLTVDDPAEGEVVVTGRRLARVEFGAPPPGAAAAAARVHGSVEDRFGRTFTGPVTWDGTPVLQSDNLHGRDEDDDSRRIPFGEIRTVEPRLGGAWVTSVSGEGFDLYRPPTSHYGDSDVRWYRRTIRILDRRLGTVDIDWDDFRKLRLHPGSRRAGYDDFDGGGPLFGVVATRSGKEIRGWIRWGADKEWTWDYLDGTSDNVEIAVEFGNIRRIGQSPDGLARITLLDGRSYELSGSGDVDGDSHVSVLPMSARAPSRITGGIFVFPDTGPGEREGTGQSGTDWHYVAWEDFREARFRRTPEGPGS